MLRPHWGRGGALYIAWQEGDMEVARLLLARSADPNKASQTPADPLCPLRRLRPRTNPLPEEKYILWGNIWSFTVC